MVRPNPSNGKHARRIAPQHGYPRPLLVRENWTNLNGPWDFAIDADAVHTSPEQVRFDQKITVPFSPETPASGVENAGFFRACWYRRSFDPPQRPDGHRLILHFGAVDWHATVWVNGRRAAEHDGGYTPFSADITDLLADDANEIVVRAEDDPQDLAKPRGKQDWCPRGHSIWYDRTTGIWQTVWLEAVPATHVASLKWTPNVERWEILFEATLAGPRPRSCALRLTLKHKGRVIVDDTYRLARENFHDLNRDSFAIRRKLGLPDPGIDDYRGDFFWAPHSPNLLDATVELTTDEGEPIDRVTSYTAMRSATLQGDRFVLNTRPYYLRLVLNQGYWPQSGLTPPDDDALRKDVELIKAMGFNGVRMHQKIEDPRFLYWADRLGLLVWEEMPSPYAFTHKTVERIGRTWTEAMERDLSHPCIIAWVPVNESWGVPDLPDVPAQRHFVKAMYHLTKSLDPTRPVIGNDGWESVATDIIAIHDYDADPKQITKRYAHPHDSFASAFKERPGHRIVILEEQNHLGLPVMLTEFGGIAFSKDRAAWGYSRARTGDEFAARYAHLLEHVRVIPLFAGFCYTQFTDTYQEANGLLYMDRTPKFPLEQIAVATRGPESDIERRIASKWKQRLLTMQRQAEKAQHESPTREA